jgi:hypothetical protein
MKTLISFAALTVFIVASSFTMDVQQQLNKQSEANCFDYFRIHRQGKAGVALTWAVNNPNVKMCVVERSYDGDFFEEAGSVVSNGNSAHKYLDTEVYPGTIYYRVTAMGANGFSECSPVQTIRIVQKH